MAIHDGMSVVMCGMISGKRTLVTKNGRLMAFVNLEDLYGITEVVVFPNVYEKCMHVIDDDKVVAISGKLNFKEDEAPKVLADEVLDIDEAAEKGFARRQTPQSPAYGRRQLPFRGAEKQGEQWMTPQSRQSRDSSPLGEPRNMSPVGGPPPLSGEARNMSPVDSSPEGRKTKVNGNGGNPHSLASPKGEVAERSEAGGVANSQATPQGRVKIRIPADMDAAGTLEEIKVNLKRHPGSCEVLIYLPTGKTLRTDQSMWVEPTESLRKQMAAIIGSENVKF